MHPIHTEAVAWIAGRGDVLCTIFVLAAVLAYLRARRRPHALWTAAFGALALAAVLSKETGLALVLYLPLLEAVLPRETSTVPDAGGEAKRGSRAAARRARRGAAQGAAHRGNPGRRAVALSWIVLAAVVALYFSLRRAAIGMTVSPAATTDESLFGSVFGSLGWYVVKIVWPAPQSAFVTEAPGTGLAVVGFVALALFLGALANAVLRGKGGAPGLAAAGLFFAGLAPALAVALLRVSETPLAERYLYLPACGATLLAGTLLVRGLSLVFARSARRARVMAVAVAVAAAVPAGWAAIERSAVWRSDLVFWTDAALKSPDHGLPRPQLGLAHFEAGDIDRAIEQYRLAVDLSTTDENRSKALNNLGNAYQRVGRAAEAIAAYERALAAVPRYAIAHYNLGNLEYALALQESDPARRREHVNNALKRFETALKINPRYTRAHLRAGTLLAQIGRLAPGRRHLEEVVRLAPADSRDAQEAKELLARLPAGAE